MRASTLSAAVLVLLAAGPALAGGPAGGGRPGGPCCAPPPPPGPCCGHGGGARNVNINVNARASAVAEASTTSHFNARTYDLGGVRVRGHGGTVHVGGGYGGDAGGYGYVGGAPVYSDIDPRALACASAPFGYVVSGFGRDDRRPPSCGGRHVRHDDGHDRGGRYGYSGRHAGRGESAYERRESYEAFEAYEEYGEYGAYDRGDGRGDSDYGIGDYERGYIDGRRDCDCRAPAPYPPPYLPEPPRHRPPAPAPAHPHPPRQHYRQEPGERG